MRLSLQKLTAFYLCAASAIMMVCFINLLIGCVTTPPIAVPQEAKENRINACLPNAIMMCEGLKKAGIQAKVLSIFTASNGHAVCVYLYPTGKNQMWVWDADWGSVQVVAYFDNPEQIARAWMNKQGNYATITYAEFRN